ARLGLFDAVVDGVADQVQQRIADLFDHRTIELGVLALDDEVDLLALLTRDIAYDARQPTENGLERQHARLHNLLLQLVGDAADVLRGLLQVGQYAVIAEPVDEGIAELDQTGAINDQLADEIEQGVEARHVDAD